MWVYCGSGYRASITASVLDRPGRQVVLVNDSYDAANAAGLEDEHPTEGAGASQTESCSPARRSTGYSTLGWC